MTRSEWFEIFLSAANKTPRPRRDDIDGFPGLGDVLSRLTGEERTAAEDILIAKLDRGDVHSATALADAGCTRAIPVLRTHAAGSRWPIMRIFTARALLRLGDHSGRDAVSDLLRTGEADWGDRLRAVRLLAEFPDPDTDLMLHVASTDADDLVRSAATSALLTAHGLAEDETAHGAALMSIGGRLLSNLRTIRDGALADLRSILARWQAGESAAELGLTWQPDRDAEPLRSFLTDLADETPERADDFATDGLAALTGRTRLYVEDLLLTNLDQDRRAIRAVARLGVRRAAGPLRELAATAGDDTTAAEAATAMRQLTNG